MCPDVSGALQRQRNMSRAAHIIRHSTLRTPKGTFPGNLTDRKSKTAWRASVVMWTYIPQLEYTSKPKNTSSDYLQAAYVNNGRHDWDPILSETKTSTLPEFHTNLGLQTPPAYATIPERPNRPQNQLADNVPMRRAALAPLRN